MLIDCKNCGAPLDVPERGWFTTCAYCNTTQRVAKPPQGIFATPPDWRAPQTWTPPPRGPVQGVQPLKYNPYAAKQKTRGVVTLFLFFMVGIPAVVVAGVVLFVVGAKPQRGGGLDVQSSEERAEDWDGSSTFTCDKFDKPVLKDLDLYVKANPPFRLEGQCRLTIVDSKLRLQHWFDPGDMHNHVTIRGSQITLEKAPSDARLGKLTLEKSKLSLPSRSAWRLEQRLETHGGELIFRDENGLLTLSLAGAKLDGTKVRVEGREGKPTVFFTSRGNGSLDVVGGAIHLKAGKANDPVTLASCHGIGDAELDGTAVVVEQPPVPGPFTLFDLHSINAKGKMTGGSIKAEGKPIGLKGRNADVDGTKLNGSALRKRR